MVEPLTRWHYEYITSELFLASHLTGILYAGKTRYQRVEIIETAPFGRCLILDGRTQSSEADEFVYHEALVHPGLTTVANPRSVFIAGGGEGATLREVLSHQTVERVVMVDLDQEVVKLCQEYLPNHHQGSFQDPRLTLLHEDAAAYLERNPERYDFLVLDIPDPLEGGPAYLLYTREFYSLVRQRLSEGGLLVVQAGPCGPINYNEVFTAIHHTIASVFPVVVPYRAHVASFGSPWGFILAGERLDPREMAANEVDARLAARLARPLRFYDGATHQGGFTLPKYIRQALAREERLITRDSPLYAP
ncbi:MAG: polyamine aminopropyltransferase [Chloroflexi bacterium]|nr:polyamine aminopropyltransferase [Chloroflexota bacterium]